MGDVEAGRLGVEDDGRQLGKGRVAIGSGHLVVFRAIESELLHCRSLKLCVVPGVASDSEQQVCLTPLLKAGVDQGDAEHHAKQNRRAEGPRHNKQHPEHDAHP